MISKHYTKDMEKLVNKAKKDRLIRLKYGLGEEEYFPTLKVNAPAYLLGQPADFHSDTISKKSLSMKL